MSNVVKLTRTQERALENIDAEYENFVDDLGGFLWHIRAVTRKSFEEIGAEIGCCGQTLRNLANRDTKFPHMRTVWKVLRGLDNRQIIRHSMLEQYRPLSRESLKVIREHERQSA
jgi:hypothetical protein